MPDNKKLKGKQDDIRINISQSWERQYWSRKLGISQARLRALVKHHGPLLKNLLQCY